MLFKSTYLRIGILKTFSNNNEFRNSLSTAYTQISFPMEDSDNSKPFPTKTSPQVLKHGAYPEDSNTPGRKQSVMIFYIDYRSMGWYFTPTTSPPLSGKSVGFLQSGGVSPSAPTE